MLTLFLQAAGFAKQFELPKQYQSIAEKYTEQMKEEEKKLAKAKQAEEAK